MKTLYLRRIEIMEFTTGFNTCNKTYKGSTLCEVGGSGNEPFPPFYGLCVRNPVDFFEI